MREPIIQCLKAEQDSLRGCIEDFLKGNATKRGEKADAALAFYARKIPDLFLVCARKAGRKMSRRALECLSERAVAAGVPFVHIERFAATFRRFLRGLFYREFGKSAKALRQALRLKDNFLEDTIGEYSRALIRRENELVLETERQHATFFSDTIFPAFLANAKGIISNVNPAFLEHFGGSIGTYDGKSVYETLALLGVSPARIRAFRKQLRTDGFVREMPMTGRCAKGRVAFLEVSSNFTRSARGRIAGLHGMIHNVTAHVVPQIKYRKAIETLKRQGQIAKRANRTLKAVYESSPAALLFVNPENKITMMNQKASEILGFCVTGDSGLASRRLHFTAFGENLQRPEELRGLVERLEQEPALRCSGVLEMIEPHRFIQYETLPVLDARGSQLGRLWVFLDITRQIESERIREDLTHMIVHDLKSPLTALSGAAQVLRMQFEHPSEPVLRTIEIMDRNVATMLDMIMNLLDIHRFEAHGLKPDLQPIALETMARDTIESMGGLVKDRKIRLVFPRKHPIPRAMGEPSLIARVLTNLLSNAIKHTPEGTGEIRIGARNRANGFVEISVSDNGEGIPPEYHDRIFEKFQQVSGRKIRRATDTGLGLAFCKLAVEAHGGTIGVESALDRGSRFFFTLPVEGPEKAQDG